MCELCAHMPCLRGCPNEYPGAGVTLCQSCGEAICAGDAYCVIDGDAYCGYCMDEMSRAELITLLGVTMLTAEDEREARTIDGEETGEKGD